MSEKLIQLIAYRKGIDKKTAKPYVWQKHFEQIKVGSITKLFENLDAIVSAIPEEERYDVHYTNANCHEPKADRSVPLRLFAYQEMIPIDLDGIDLDHRDEYISLVIDLLGLDESKTGIFCSGHGLHFVIALTQRIETGEELHRLQKYYKAICIKINIAIFEAGLIGNADPIRLSESATLRLPKTMNTKDPENPVLSYVIQKDVIPQPFYLDKLVNVVEEEEVSLSLRAVDTKAVLAGCDFLKYCFNNPASVSEPQWYAMLGTLAFIPDIGVNLCHTYSEKHNDYSFEATDTKAQQAISFGKARTCESINQVYPSCSSCPHYKKVKTPLSIKGDDFISTEADGFHTLIMDSNGGATKHVPNYGDLLKFFAKTFTYVVNKSTKEVSVFNGKYWTDYTSTEVDAFATTHFNPIANNTKRAEFRGLLVSNNVVDSTFFGKSNVGHINFNNGVLRLVDRVLLPHSPEYGFNYVLPYDYNPWAKCPEFQKLMNNITLSDVDLQNLLLEYIGYAISGRKASYGSKALILTGRGSNGKSTFLNVIKMLVGSDCYSAVSLTDMANPNARYSMVGKLFNICEEEEDDALRNGTAMFKSITTGADVLVKKLYTDVAPMRIDAKLILSCNELPSSKENTYAIYRRMLIVPFRAKFDKSTGLDKGIEERVQDEMSGVYNLVLDAYDRLVANNGIFSESELATKALAEYKYSNSFYNQFAEHCLGKGTADDHVFADELISMFNSWAQMNNVKLSPTAIKLARELKIIGIIPDESTSVRVGSSTKRAYKGVKKLNSGAF
jgi:P4 family phage/plasmid primase-like protien